jgi:membrane fusion protein (multidrug efflux system)
MVIHRWMLAAALGLAAAGCGSGSPPPGGDRPARAGSGAEPSRTGAGQGRPAGPWGPRAAADTEAAAVPVEVQVVGRHSVASYIETNGTLEAENEVDIVARTSGPIIELATEEGQRVKKGQLMARIDPAEAQAQVQIAEVALREAERAFDRAKSTFEAQLISQAEYDQARSAREAAQAALVERQVQLSYTRITAPFDAVVAERTVKLADNVTPNQKLFRISDFDPLLSKIQVPEKELPRLHKGQPAYLTVEAWPKERFAARVLRISPTVDAATGTVRVTLEVQARERLRPGMFASVFLEVERHDGALTIPKSALSLESLGDTVYVVDGKVAARRPVQLGFEEADRVEVLSGLAEGDRVIVVGQDGLSDGTPVQILEGPGAPTSPPARTAERAPGEAGPRARAAAPSPPPPATNGGARGPAVASDPPPRAPDTNRRRRGRLSVPPPPAVAACVSKQDGDPCTFTARRGDVTGACRAWPGDPAALACVANDGSGSVPGPDASEANGGPGGGPRSRGRTASEGRDTARPSPR